MYGVLLIISILLITHWVFLWFPVKYKNDLTNTSKRYDVQFKRLAKYLLFLFFLYILYGVIEFREKNEGYYLNKISIPRSLEYSGYNDTTLLIQLQELKEEISDFGIRYLPTKRYWLGTQALKTNDDLNVNLEVQGFGFPLKNIGLIIGEKLWGDKKKYINISVLEDSLKLSASVDITGEPVKQFEIFLEDNFDKQVCLQKILREIEYYILESTDPVLVAGYYMDKGENYQALSILSKKTDTVYNDLNLNYFRNKSLVYNNLYNYKESKKIIDKLLLVYPNNVILLNDRGVIDFSQKNYKEAFPFFDKALAIDSTYYFSAFNKSEYFYYTEKNIDSALFYLRRPIANKHDNTQELQDLIYARFKLSFLLGQKADWQNAEYYFIQACNSSPYTYNMLLNNWVLFPYDIEGDYVKKVKQLYDKEQDYIPAKLCYALYSPIENKNKESLLKSCLAKYPDLVPAQLGLAALYVTRKEYFKTDSLLSKVISVQPENYVAYCIKAISEFSSGNNIMGEKYIRKSLKINKFYWPSFTILTSILSEEERKNELVSLCEEYYEYDPFNTESNYYLGREYYMQGNENKAIYYLSRVEQYSHNEELKGNSVFDLAYCYYNTKSYQMAAVYFDKLLKTSTNHDETVGFLLKLRQCYIQIGDSKKENQILEQLKSMNVTPPNERIIY